MKEFLFNDRKILIKSIRELSDWDSEFERDLYDFCYQILPSKGNYKPYIDVDKFVEGETGYYGFNLINKLNSYGFEIEKSEKPSKKCTNKDQFTAQLIIGNRLIFRWHSHELDVISSLFGCSHDFLYIIGLLCWECAYQRWTPTCALFTIM